MKNSNPVKNFIFAMSALSVFIVLLWLTFYFFTMKISTRNLIRLADAGSESILSSIEDELLTIEDTAYSLAHYDRVEAMVVADDVLAMYDLGEVASERSDTIIGSYNPADNVVVFNSRGDFYRLRGTISNTALKRAFYLISATSGSVFGFSIGDSSYIGVYNTITDDDAVTGYVVLLIEELRLRQLLSSTSETDYMGAMLTMGDKVLCSSDPDMTDTAEAADKSVFTKEKEIGLTGMKLFVYCRDSVSERITSFFRVAMPTTVAVIFAVMAFFIVLCLKMLVKGAELEKERTLIALLKKQISAHFTVNTLYAVRALINKDRREDAAKMCDELSALLRYANAGDEYISLMEEFYVLEQYAMIMQTRYPDKFRFIVSPEDAYAEIFIPRMLLQPIVENAIVHGFSDRQGTIRVDTDIDYKLGRVTISITDDGKGMSEPELKELHEAVVSSEPESAEKLRHIALPNICRRIHLVCGPEYGLTVNSKLGEGTTVNVVLPIK